jgi:hypothetical protein
MKLRDIFVVITATFVAIAIAAPAGAQLKCKAKQNKKTGAIAYSFVNKAGGTVVYALGDYDFNDVTLWHSFANEDTCQVGGKGRNCLVSNDAAEAAIAPSNCKIYMADLTSGDKCEHYIKGCQVAQRPPPTTGYFPLIDIDSETDPASIWDADTGIAWYISPDNQPRSLDDHKTYLADVLNGGKSDGVDYACLSDGCDLALPTLAQLEKLGQDCASVAVSENGVPWAYPGPQEDLCTALWPDPSLGEPANCAWSLTAVTASDPDGQSYAVCLVDSGGARSSFLVAVILRTESSFTPLRGVSVFSRGLAFLQWRRGIQD